TSNTLKWLSDPGGTECIWLSLITSKCSTGRFWVSFCSIRCFMDIKTTPDQCPGERESLPEPLKLFSIIDLPGYLVWLFKRAVVAYNRRCHHTYARNHC